MSNAPEDFLTNQLLEMRRGVMVLSVLSQLQTPQYGYGLLQRLEQVGFTVDAGTLYPLLRRLQKQGVLDSEWQTSDTRPRKYYRLNDDGVLLYKQLKQEWQDTATIVMHMTKGDRG